MEISEQLLCLFSGQVEQRDGSYVVEIPDQELELGDIEVGETYRFAVVATQAREAVPESEPDSTQESVHEEGLPKPPVEEGESRVVEIEDIGEQGDGITRVERGYVVIVPDTEQGERVRVEVTDVQPNVAFAEVVERLDYYE